MFLVGLTGGIATGKSTVSKMFRDLDVPVIDADLIARQVVEPGKKAWKDIRREFGEEVFESDGQLNRKKLGGLIFGDPLKRITLNSITHPQIAKQIAWEIFTNFFRGYQFVIIDTPLLFEANTWIKLVHRIIVVHCEGPLQLTRLMNRDQLNVSEATSRVRAQIPMEEKCQRADFVIRNSGKISDTKRQVDEVYRELKKSKRHLLVRIPIISLFLLVIYALNKFLY